MRRLSHLTPRYIFGRALVEIDQRKNPRHPWLTRASVQLLFSLLKTSDVGVEFGAGRSTSWFLSRISKLTSVETNQKWYDIVSRDCDKELKQKRLKLILAQDKADFFEIFNSFEDESVDVCLVDGKFRGLCALHMISKIKNGGILIIDDVHLAIPCQTSHSPDARREKDGCASPIWSEFQEKVKEWRYIWTTDGVSDTGIWIRK